MTKIKLIGHVLGLLPLLYMLFLGIVGLGANPIEQLTHETGQWSLILLLASLAITPIVKLSSSVNLKSIKQLKLKKIMLWRKYLGLYAFFYVVMHFLIYLILDLSLDFEFLIDDIKDRPYITVGFLALLLLIPLAVTSTQSLRRKMGRHWLRLHKLVYLINALALLHFYWLIRADYSEFWWYLLAFTLFMAFRVEGIIRIFYKSKTSISKI